MINDMKPWVIRDLIRVNPEIRAWQGGPTMSAPALDPRLTQFTGYLLRRAFVRSAGVAKACIPEDAHIREVAVLAILDERGALSQRELAEITHVNQTLVVKLVDGLEAKGWVVR